MKNEIALSGNKMIYQHNAITSGRYDLTACQLDVLFMLLSNIEKNKLEYTIHISDIKQITGREWRIEQLRKSTNLMLKKTFEIQDSETLLQFVLFQYFKHNHGAGEIIIKLSEIALPYFFELKNNFTIMQLKSTLSLTSKYAKRLYAIACQWLSLGKKRFEIIELKKMLGIIDNEGNEQFTKMSNFKNIVLDTAKKQINESTDILIDYELVKKGRSFKYIDFTIEKRKKVVNNIDYHVPIIDQKLKSDLMTYGFNEDQATQISQKETIESFQRRLHELDKKLMIGKIKVKTTPIAYLVGVYKKLGILE